MNNIPQNNTNKTEKPKNQSAPVFKILLICAIVAALGFFGAKSYFNTLGKAQSKTYSFSKSNHIIKSLNFLSGKKQKDSISSQKSPSAAFSFPKTVAARHSDGKKARAQGGLVLNGILFSSDKSFALINNSVVKEGDKIADAIVVQIKEDYVELENKTSRFKLTPRNPSR